MEKILGKVTLSRNNPLAIKKGERFKGIEGVVLLFSRGGLQRGKGQNSTAEAVRINGRETTMLTARS